MPAVELVLLASGRLGKPGSVNGRQLSATDASAMLTRCLKAFQLGSPLYRNIVGSLAVVGILLFILGLALAVANLDHVAKGMLYTLVAVVIVIAITLLCATPSGAATHFFKVRPVRFSRVIGSLTLSVCWSQTVIPITCGACFAISIVVSLTCDDCNWVIYPAILFAITLGILLLARLQVCSSHFSLRSRVWCRGSRQQCVVCFSCLRLRLRKKLGFLG
jgi:hypothetical protein